MKNRNAQWLVGILLSGGVLSAALWVNHAHAQLIPPQPAAQPAAASQPAPVSSGLLASAAPLTTREIAKPLPTQYQPLLQRSMFTKDRLRRPGDFPTRTFNPTPRVAYTAPPPPAPVFTGVLLETDDLVAFLEDPNTHKVTLAREGETLPFGFGTVEKITLTYMLVRTSPRLDPKKIEIGYTLAGVLHTSSSSFSSPITYTPPTINTRPLDNGNNNGRFNRFGPNTGAAPGTPTVPGADQITDPVELMRLQRALIEMQAQQLQAQQGQPAGDNPDNGGGN